MSVLKVKKNGTWENVSGTSGHTHTVDDITNFPEINLDGGDADTVDGKHASYFASASSVADLQTLVGDTPVAEQITVAIANKSDSNHNHNSLYDAVGAADGALASAKQYTDGEVAKKTQVRILTWGADD